MNSMCRWWLGTDALKSLGDYFYLSKWYDEVITGIILRFSLQSQILSPSESTGRPWYHGEISQTEAEVLLDVSKPGRFLVRKAGPTRYFLSCVTDNHLLLHLPWVYSFSTWCFSGFHSEVASCGFRIQQLGRFFYLNAGKFTTLADAVQHHCEMVDTAEPVQAQISPSNSSIMPVSFTNVIWFVEKWVATNLKA